jgi:pilus assembly protein Flp/PilA
MMTSLCSLWRGDDGATSIEYAFLAALISVAIIAGALAVGTTLAGTFGDVRSQMLLAAGSP